MADKKVKGAGDRFLPGSNIAKHREWRGLKDTWYDYVEWVKVLGIMGGFVAKSPVRIARGMLTYRWMGSYLGALNMIDRCVEGLRGPALRVARLYLNTIMKGSTTSIAEMMMGDRRFGDNAFGRTQVVLEQTMCPEILAGFKNLRPAQRAVPGAAAVLHGSGCKPVLYRRHGERRPAGGFLPPVEQCRRRRTAR